MTFLDFCSGIGGFRLGLELAGYKCIGFCENDKFAVKSYRAMYDTKGEWYRDDVTKIKSEEIPYADIWCFGFPCQDISLAGRKRGIDGKRSGIYFKIIDIIKGKEEKDKPTYLLIENVRNLLSINKGFDFARVLSELDKAGYDAIWQVLNSKDFGVPQHRERVYIIANLRSRGRREILHLKGKNTATIKQVINGAQAYRVLSTDGVSCTLCGNAGGVGAKTGLYFIDQSTTKSKLTKFARCITARYTSGIVNRPGMNSAVLETKEEQENSEQVDKNKVCLLIKEATKKGFVEAEVGDSINIAYANSNTRRARVGKQVAHTLDTQCMQGTLCSNYRIRRLTPKECFRLQGFPDHLFEKARAVNSDAQLYKQAGNAVTVNVAYAIAQSLKMCTNSK
jgi:DNA (cytosine-5)-methyltransferase 1